MAIHTPPRHQTLPSIHTHMHGCAQAQSRTHTHTRTHTRTHMHTCALAHTYARSHIHMHTHARVHGTCVCLLVVQAAAAAAALAQTSSSTWAVAAPPSRRLHSLTLSSRRMPAATPTGARGFVMSLRVVRVQAHACGALHTPPRPLASTSVHHACSPSVRKYTRTDAKQYVLRTYIYMPGRFACFESSALFQYSHQSHQSKQGEYSQYPTVDSCF